MLFLGGIELSAQCVPDSTITGLYSPTAQEGLPEATIGEAYTATIHVRVPAETLTVSIDSVVFTSVTGLPSGLTYECDQPGCRILGGDFGCIRISGVPDSTNQVGQHDLVASFELHSMLPTITETLTDYYILVNESKPTAVAEVGHNDVRLWMDQNPTTENGILWIDGAKGRAAVSIFTLLGASAGQTEVAMTGEPQAVELGSFGLGAGVYFASIQSGESTQTIRFIVQ